ncbi:MAG: TadE/TadG family type IV pilus assembly protein [Rhodovibrionaceae bacterium]
MIAARFLKRFKRDQRGSVFIELGVSMVVLTILILGGVEIARFVLLQQKLDRISSSMGDLVSRGQVLTETEVNNIFAAVVHLAEPFDFAERGAVVLTSVHRDAGEDVEIIWQRSGAGSLSVTSKIGGDGAAPDLPDNFLVRDNETVFAAEVFYDFEPILTDRFGNFGQLYHSSWFRARSIDQSIFQ